MDGQLDYRQWLTHVFEDRKQRNPRYSVRKFAKDLNTSSSSLAEVLSGKRHLSASIARNIFEKFAPDGDRSRFLHQVNEARSKRWRREDYQQMKLDHYQLIADWYHFAILDLALLKRNRAEPSWIAERLQISEAEAKDALERLQRLHLISIENEKLVRKSPSLTTPNDVPSDAIRKHHAQCLNLATQSLKIDDIYSREFQTSVIPINPKKLIEAKRLIRNFHFKIRRLLESDPLEEVYCLGIQLFPLSRPRKEKTK